MSDQNNKPNIFSNLGAGSSTSGSAGFNFGSAGGGQPAAGNGGGTGLFGSNAGAGGSLFGNTAKKPEEGNKTTSLFGNLQTPSKTSTAPDTLSTPANAQNAPGNTSTTPMFSPPAAGASIFGQNASVGQATSSSAAPLSMFGTVAADSSKDSSALFGSAKPSETKPGLFGQPSKTGGSFFGQTSSQAQSSQDQAKTSTGLFGAPAASAPSSAEGQKSTPFGAPAASTSTDSASTPKLLFGAAPPVSSSSQPSQSALVPSSGGLFGTAVNSQPPQSSSAATGSGGIFGTAASSTQQSPNLFGAPKSTAPDADAQTNASGATTSAPTTGLFGSLTQTAQAGSSTPATSAKPAPSPFGAPATSSSQASSAEAKPSQASTASVPSTLFGGLNKTTETAKPESGSTAPQTTANTTATSGNSAENAAAGPQSGSGGPASGTAPSTAAAFGASTSGPVPTPQSRLKNKTMDDIITRWATDLKKYQKEFQTQAEKVAQWDRLLVENSNAITKLYSRTFQAERDTAEVQKQLSAVEDNQAELSQWLDRYEQEIEALMAKEGMGQKEGLQGPDQERERTYKAAERVQEKLSDMGNELTGLIEEINSVSNTLSNSTKPDDPLSQIVRILNNHLSQLQQIDQDTAALQAKVAAAKAESQRLGYRSNGIESAADDFYRSIRSGR